MPPGSPRPRLHDRSRPQTAPLSRAPRTQRRVTARDLPDLTAHLSGGSRVTLLDVSLAGVRLQTTRHMRPGQVVSVRFAVDDTVFPINATVVRASVVHVHAEEVRYETGLRLCDDFACEPLQVPLVERRQTDGDVPDVVDDATPFVFTHLPEQTTAADVHRGWWLASPRRRTRRAIEGL